MKINLNIYFKNHFFKLYIIFVLSDIPDVSYSSSEDDFYDAYEDEEEWSKPNPEESVPMPVMRRKYKNRMPVR